jgi:hypothetical protein
MSDVNKLFEKYRSRNLTWQKKLEWGELTEGNLVSMIYEFLDDRAVTDGGYAPIAEHDVDTLYKIFDALVKLKYEPDCDGDRRLHVKIEDRNHFRFTRPALIPVDYSQGAPHGNIEDRRSKESALVDLIAWASQELDREFTLRRWKRDGEI